MAAEIVIVGLGPGRWGDMTLAARDALENASQTGQPVYFRTLRHPTVMPILKRFGWLAPLSFDALYETSASFADLYREMAQQLCAAASAPDAPVQVYYAVPGHPLVGERSVREVRRLAAEQGIATRLIAGLSFLEPVCAAMGIDLMDGLQVLDATELAGLGPERVAGVIIPTRPVLVAQLYNRRLASGVKLALGELYPDEAEVQLVRAGGVPEAEALVSLKLYELDRGEHADHLTCLYLPPLDPLTPLRAPETLRWITERLRAPEGGCPWDRKQTHLSLKRYVLEEAYEVADVLDEIGPTPLPEGFTPETVAPELGQKLADELGDLLLQVYLHAEVGRQEGLFTLGDVLEHINAKLIRRHPHVFGEVQVRDAEHVLRNWEEIKKQERVASGEEVQAESLLRGIPINTPALAYAQELQKKASKTGFEWPQVQDIVAKVSEEAREVGEAIEQADHEHAAEELGDLFFSLVGLARRMDLSAEDVLRAANAKFRRRFEAMEARVRTEGRVFDSLSRKELIALWAEVKQDE